MSKSLNSNTPHIGVERLRELYAMMWGVPDQRVGLNTWRCGTRACAVGWACLYPPFRDQGLGWSTALGDPVLSKDGHLYMSWDAVAHFFDISHDVATRIFGAPITRVRHVTDKALLLQRVREYLWERGHITDARSRELAIAERQLFLREVM